MKVAVITNQYSNCDKVHNPVIKNQHEFLLGFVDSIQTIYPSGKYKFFSYFFLFFDLICLAKSLKKNKFDIIHVQFGGLIAFLATFILNKKCIVSFHGTDLHGGTPKNYLQHLKSKVNCLLSIYAAKHAKLCTVVSPNLIKYLPESIRSDVSVISTGANLNVFYPLNKAECKEKLNLSSDVKYILFSDISGSPVKRKDIAIATIEYLNNISSKKYELLIMSKVSYELVPTYICSCDCILITSDREGSPNIVKEGVACNVPIISVDVGDVVDYSMIFNNIIISERDPQKLALAIESLSDSTFNYDFNLISDVISLSRTAKETYNIYQRAIQSNE